MNQSFSGHSFHIPVMGIGFSIDTPIKVAPYGISSVISLIDDGLMETMREFYCRKFNFPFEAIPSKNEDSRAERITAYLNLVNEIVREKIEKLKSSLHEKGSELEKYFDMLPDWSELKKKYAEAIENYSSADLKKWIYAQIHPGSVDVNIMTKLDVENFREGEKLPVEFNDAHAALRGFANSDLHSSLVLSAGLNPRLYSYLEKFPDFFPDVNGNFKKRIILKTSDYRSAFIQGKFLAKKGIWVSEFRVESGLNCGGHAFASDGYLLGPILEEFRLNRTNLVNTLFEIWSQAISDKGLPLPATAPEIKITAQGGVGTAAEHQFLLDYYQLDSVGWGSPFLLVPEATCMDAENLELLSKAEEDDLYLSNISPLGVPFNSVRGNAQDLHKHELIEQGKPGSACPKKYAKLSFEFSDKPVCTASSLYQKQKISQIKALNLSITQESAELEKVTGKACLCVGLGVTALTTNYNDSIPITTGASVCPGPNIAYFSQVASLKEMIDHIYGKINLIKRKDRPNFLIKELSLYIDYLETKIEESRNNEAGVNKKYVLNFRKNLLDGISYYRNLFAKVKDVFGENLQDNLHSLDKLETDLHKIELPV